MTGVQAKARYRKFLAIYLQLNNNLNLAHHVPLSRSNASSSPRKSTARNCFVLSHDSKPSAGAAPEADGKNTKDVTTLDWKVMREGYHLHCIVRLDLSVKLYVFLLVSFCAFAGCVLSGGCRLRASPGVQSDGSALATGCYDGRARVWSKGGEHDRPHIHYPTMFCVYYAVHIRRCRKSVESLAALLIQLL